MLGNPAVQAGARGGPAAASSPQLLRQANLRTALGIFWAAPPGRVLTAAELIEATGLARATVLAVCDDLVALGWLREVPPDQAPGAARGRRARHFAFRADAGHVVAVDLGFTSATAVVADLSGTVRGRGRATFGHDDLTADRLRPVRRIVADALAQAGVGADAVRAVCLGVAAPVDKHGNVPPGNPYWETVRINPAEIVENRQGWPAIIENDANLAARAERGAGLVDPGGDYVTLLAGERLGAGVVLGGVLQHGHRGGCGEMEYLDHLEGVGTTDGIGALARQWAHEALAAGRASVMRAVWDPAAGRPAAADVFAAAGDGDPVATGIVDRLGERFALVVSTLASLLNPEAVVVAGAVADTCAPVVRAIEERVGTHTRVPPRVLASRLGADVVLVGAVQSAVEYVRDHALDAAG